MNRLDRMMRADGLAWLSFYHVLYQYFYFGKRRFALALLRVPEIVERPFESRVTRVFIGFGAAGLPHLVSCSRLRNSPAPACCRGRYRGVYSCWFFPLLTREIMVKSGDRRRQTAAIKPETRDARAAIGFSV